MLKINIPKDIKLVRKKHNLSQPKFSNYLNSLKPKGARYDVTTDQIKKYETDRAVPPATKYLKIMQSLKYVRKNK